LWPRSARYRPCQLPQVQGGHPRAREPTLRIFTVANLGYGQKYLPPWPESDLFGRLAVKSARQSKSACDEADGGRAGACAHARIMRVGQARRLVRRDRDKDCRARADHPGWQPDADGYAHARSLTHGALFFDQARALFFDQRARAMPGLTRAGGVVCDAQGRRSATDDALVGSALATRRASGAW
jgi:hypothetical protein